MKCVSYIVVSLNIVMLVITILIQVIWRLIINVIPGFTFIISPIAIRSRAIIVGIVGFTPVVLRTVSMKVPLLLPVMMV